MRYEHGVDGNQNPMTTGNSWTHKAVSTRIATTTITISGMTLVLLQAARHTAHRSVSSERCIREWLCLLPSFEIRRHELQNNVWYLVFDSKFSHLSEKSSASRPNGKSIIKRVGLSRTASDPPIVNEDWVTSQDGA